MDPDTPLSEVRLHIKAHAEDGLTCPACNQHVQIYWRTINAGQAASIVRLYRMHLKAPFCPVHLPSAIGRRSAEEAKLNYWGLVEDDGTQRTDGGRAGYWRLTPKGADWAAGRIAVPRYVRVFNGQRWGNPTSFSKSGKQKPDVTVFDALRNKFDYASLMEGEG